MTLNGGHGDEASPQPQEQRPTRLEKAPVEAGKKCRGAGKNKELREQLLKQFFDNYTP